METFKFVLERIVPIRIRRYFPILLVSVFLSNMAYGATATVGGYTYTYETRTYGALIQNRPYTDYNVAITPNPTGALTIPSMLGSYKVYAIGEYAFKNCSFTSVTVPEGVKEISGYAFYYCGSMSTITLPLSIVSIYGNGNVFYGCASLRTLNTPAHYNVANAFSYHKDRITTVNIISGCTAIQASAFAGFTALKNLTIPTSVKTIGASSFNGCSSLETVVIPEGVKTIESAAFSNCTKLKSVTIPSSVTNIASSAFSGCTALTSVIVPNSVLKLGTGVFKGCSKLTEVVLPAELVNLPSQIFQDCTMLQSVAIPSCVTEIEDYAFSGCASLSSVSLPAVTKSIGNYAFNN